MKSYRKIFTVILILMSFKAYCQDYSKRLSIGDTVPEIEFKNIYNYPFKTAKLSDFKGKAVILDLWNKTCSNCIESFPHLQQLQSDFKDDLVILLINDQPKETRESLGVLFKNSPIMQQLKLPMVFEDERFGNKSELFPHWGVPFHVWIDKYGTIQAITSGKEATHENIRKLINGNSLNVLKRNDLVGVEVKDSFTSWLEFNKGKYIDNMFYYRKLDSEHGSNVTLARQPHSLMMRDPNAGNLTGGSYTTLFDEKRKKIGRSFNITLISHFIQAYKTYLPVFIESGDLPDLETSFIYEYLNPEYNEDVFHKTYQEDLKFMLGYSGSIEMREMDSFIIYRTEQELKLGSEGGFSLYEDTKSKKGVLIQNRPMMVLQSHLQFSSQQDKFGNYAQVIDETGIDARKRIDLNLHFGLENIEQLNKELNKYGLAVRKEKRQLPVFVIRK